MKVHRQVRAVGVAAALATTLLTAPSAHADATDLPLAIAETELARSVAVADAVQYNVEEPEVTCANPTVFGSVVTPAVYVRDTVAVWGRDQAEGAGECQSLQKDAFTATLRVAVEWRDRTGTWREIPNCFGTVTTPASDGVARPVVQPFMCPIDPAAEAAARPRRVHGVLTTSVKARAYRGYSPVYASPHESMIQVETDS